MSGGDLFAIWALVVLAPVGFGLVVNPSENQWVRSGDEVRLNCKTAEPIHSCSWETPYGTHYPLEKGIVAEGGRLAGFGEGSGGSCGVVINGVENRDAGDWKCHVSVVSGGEAHPGDSKVSLHIATRPDSVSVSNNLGKLLEAIKAANGGKVVSPVACVVGKADPKPAFEWFLGSERLKNAQTQDVRNEDESWSQILSYEPEASHHNQTLRCKVGHVGFQKGDETEAETRMIFDEEALNFLRKGIVEQEAATQLQTSLYPILGVVVVIGIVSLAFVIFHYKKMTWFGCGAFRERTDNPGTPQDGGSTEDVNADANAAEQGRVPRSSWFGCCVKAKKLESSTSEEVAAEKSGVQEEMVVEVKSFPADEEKVANGSSLKEADEEDGLKVPEAAEVVETVATEVKGRFRLFKWLKKAAKVEEEEASKVEEEEEAAKVKVDEAAEEKESKVEVEEAADEKAAKEEVGEKDKAEDKAVAASPLSQSAKNTAV